MNLRQAYNIEDLRCIAQRRLPRVAYEFLERVARKAEGTKWFQRYLSKDREAQRAVS